ncbi:MAG: hypothetical protein M1600_00150 [Firmicutes bacterium]|jgi:prolyl-tRNA editing enzyme YbaK/EbsC (Cys-tRNA(Pro) deacylase)|nr:hypothetical protein [Bacillota bacterium]
MDKLRTVLEQSGVQFEIIHHEKTIRTAQEGADYLEIAIGQTAPVLILKSENGYVSLIKSGDRGRVDLQEIGGILGCDQLKPVTPTEVWQITGYRIGAVPLMGLPFPCILDRGLFRYPFIYGGTGQPESTLKITPDALEMLNLVVGFI